MDTEDNERTMHLDKINELIDHVNLLARIRNDFSKNVEEICGLINELHDEIYCDDSWLRLVELNKINALLDETLDYVWKTFYSENREKHEKNNIDKYRDTDGYVSEYTDIVNDKLELVNRKGELLDSAMIEIQNKVDTVDDMKQASEIDIDRLKSIHNTLARILERRKDDILEMVNRSNAFSKPDTKKKDSKPDTKKKDSKLDTKKKDSKLDTKKKDSKPDTKKKDSKPDTKKKDSKPDTKKKDSKPDTKKKDKPDTKPDIKKKDKPDSKPDTKKNDSKPDTKEKVSKPDTEKKDSKLDTKNNTENKVSNKIKYEIQDIEKYRKVLTKMINERMNMLDLMYIRLVELIEYTNIYENEATFNMLCYSKRIIFKKDCNSYLISEVYALNIALECLREGVGNGI